MATGTKPNAGPPFLVELDRAVNAVSQALDADIFVYDGPIEFGCDTLLLGKIRKCQSRPNVAVLMTTPGGLPDMAYKIARCLQSKYAHFTLIVDSYCKSAGTLISVGADEIVLSDLGELGPLDIQIAKHDELGEYVSGLMPVQALATLRSETFLAFEEYFVSIVERSRGKITTMSAAQLASRLTTECFSTIYSHFDPMRLGEYERAMNIMLHYGRRLDRGNLTPDALNRLISDYPSHGFVIDRAEAKGLFKKIREPNPDEERLSSLVEELVGTSLDGGEKLLIEFLGPRPKNVSPNPNGAGRHAQSPKNPKARRASARPDSKASRPEGAARTGLEEHLPSPGESNGDQRSLPAAGRPRGGRRDGRNS